ncbi:MAG: flavodoxin [Promethearchaeota archaeon CR_4]|nr:MAG: flavodoxin [Candidatus Lokiarchaeota archaeon CR_4]
MVKILVIYYSLEGNTQLIAENIAKTVNADVLRLVPEKDIKSTGGRRFFWGGKQVVMKEKPVLKPFDKNPLEYDLLFIGTPVWAWSFTPALRSFFSEVKLQGKKIAIFCTHSGGMRKTLANIKNKLAGNEILGEIDFIDPLKNPATHVSKAMEWARNLITLI